MTKLRKGSVFLPATLLLAVFTVVAQDVQPALPAVRPALQLDAKVALSALVALADTHLQSVTEVLEVLAESKEVQSLDWEVMKGLLTQASRSEVPCMIWFARPDGSYYTVDQGLTSQNLKDREYFPKVMAGEVSIGELVVGKTTGKKSAVIAIPIHQADGVGGVLGAAVFLESFSELLVKETALPKGVIFYALDAKSRTAVHCKPDQVFLDPADQGSPMLTQAVRKMLAEKEGRVEYEFDGVKTDVIFQSSPLTGWKFALGLSSPAEPTALQGGKQ